MVLPNIPPVIIKNIENQIRDYLWDKKKSKVSFRILHNQKKDGGLQLVNLKKKEISLKATWPMILSTEKEYGQLVYKILRCTGLDDHIWRCSISPEDVVKLKLKSKFWEEVLWSWSQYNYYVERKIGNQILWYNSRVKIGNEICWWKDVYLNGLIYIQQLFEKGGFKSDEKVWNEYNLTKIRYNSLKSAIPGEWKAFYANNSESCYMPLPPHNYDMVVISGGRGFARKVYNFILDDVLLVHSKFLKWRQDLGEEFDDGIVDFGKLHLDIFRVTKLQSLEV